MDTTEPVPSGYNPLVVPVKLRVSAASARHLASLGIETVGDALTYAPRRYYHWGRLTALTDLPEGEDVTVLARVTSTRVVRNRSGSGMRLLVNITDGNAALTCTFFAKKEYALTRHLQLLKDGDVFLFAGKVSHYQGAPQLVQPSYEEIDPDSPEAVERRRGRPIPIYPAKTSLPSWKVGRLITQILGTINWDHLPEVLPRNLREQQSLLPTAEAYRLLHQPADDVDWQNAQRTLAWIEALVLQTALLQPRLIAEKQGKNLAPVLAARAEGSFSERLLHGLPFLLTAGQQETWATISDDLRSSRPMQRLLQADVGAGKTVVALLALLRGVEAGYQVALLAPTEVLAAQHFLSIQKLLGDLCQQIPVHLLTAARKGASRREVLTRLAAGEPGIVVGTHALLQEGVELPRLGLLVVDEQHRFGVQQREALREGKDLLPHLLVMTATPIPRTVAMTAFGDLDISVMKDIPPGRHPVQTFSFAQENQLWMSRLWQRTREEIDGGGRVYVVCPRISEDAPERGKRNGQEEMTLPSVEAVVNQLQSEPSLQGVSLAVAHGQATSDDNAAAFGRFASGQSPLLVSTSMVEVGVDVPEATMMVILGAQQFGLSQLHQLRGRVGRSHRPSVCMLVHPAEISPLSAERLQVIVDNTDGFAIAEADLRLRREGDVLGGRQSGSNSSLKFLSVRSDVAIISAARKAAEDILTEDHLLAAHPGLMEAVGAQAGEELVWLERS